MTLKSIITNHSSRIVMVGVFPPPIHGMSAVNEAIKSRIESAGIKVQVRDLSGGGLDRSFTTQLVRISRVIRSLIHFASPVGLQSRVFYISISGKLGKIYDIPFLALARVFRMRIFIHHHNFTYLNRYSHLMALVVRIAGHEALHIMLSPGMANQSKRLYHIERTISVSNAALLNCSRKLFAPIRRRIQTFGFLSNIMLEKGICEFLDLAEKVDHEGLPLKAKLAGPFQDSEIEKYVRTRLAGLPNVEYVGPKYGTDKDAFFRSIDVLIFPTQYFNEAEPLTIHEAMRLGVPIISYGRGCISEIISNQAGKVLHPNEPFVLAALDQIKRWLREPSAIQAASRGSAQQFHETYHRNVRHLNELLQDLLA